MITKICRRCNIEKTADLFPRGRDSNGLYYICKECSLKRSQAHYKNKDPVTRWVDVTFSDVKSRAKRNDLVFSLSKNNLREKLTNQQNICVYCEQTFNFHGTQIDHRSSPSLDRIFSDKGYTNSNVVICCYRCNTIKNDATLIELERLVNNLAKIVENMIDCD